MKYPGVVAHLDPTIGVTEFNVVRKRLDWLDLEVRVENADEAICPGNVIMVTTRREHATELTTGFGRLGARAAKVGEEAAREMNHYLESGAAIGRRLADQIMLPLALAGGGRFTTQPLSNHARTQAATIAHFLPVTVEVDEKDRHLHEVTIKSA